MAHQSAKSIVALIAGLGLSALLAGGWGLAGAALGVALAVLTLYSLRLIANAIAPADGRPRPSGTTTLVLLVKFPVVFAMIYFATRLPMAGITCFLIALALVYSAFVWGLARQAG